MGEGRFFETCGNGPVGSEAVEAAPNLIAIFISLCIMRDPEFSSLLTRNHGLGPSVGDLVAYAGLVGQHLLAWVLVSS